jgi:Uma2 family endonuclease
MATTTTLMSFADFERVEQGADHVELLQGELIRMPPAKRLHMEIARRLFKRLDAAVEGGKPALQVGTVYVEMGYKLSDNPASWLQPDVSLTHAVQEGDEYFVGAPLIAFEIASPNDMALDLNSKVTEYLANGAEEVWVIYPKQRQALVYERSEAVRKESRAIHSGLLPGVEIPFDQIF